MSNEVEVVGGLPTARNQRSLTDVVADVQIIQQVMESVMKPGVHYGTIPGTQKPSLWKPGSEKILSTFRIAAMPEVEDLSMPDCVRYRVRVLGVHQPSSTVLGAGIGECSSDEEKYRWRSAVCDAEWDATPENRRRHKWKKDGSSIQQVRTEPADVANTILKMAKKRAQIDMTLTVTAASDVFEQDLEDLPEEIVDEIRQRRAADGEAPIQAPQRKSAGGNGGKPAAAKARPGDATPVRIMQVREIKSGTGAKGAWTLYGITTSDKREIKTFSHDKAAVARDALEMEGEVMLTAKKDDRGGLELVEIWAIEPAEGEAEAAEGAA